MSSLSALIIALVIFALLFGLGIWEKRRNDKNISSIPIRVNVNGIRGKSTATRLITAILQEAGYKVIGKTTGSAARMIYWDKEEEKEIKRKPLGVSLNEQLRVINEAASLGAEALVCECMAVRPEYQETYQHQMLKSTLTVIVNVLEDHLDEMGPTTKEIARAFANTIPYNGAVVIPDCEYTRYFMREANKRNTKFFIANDNEIPQEYLDQFDYKLFAHNCSVALAAARAMGIPDEVAFRGMLKADPDPGALSFQEIRKNAVFVNGFAANEPSSSLEIWEDLKTTDYPLENPIVVMNCRPDRVDRTHQFIKDFFPYIPNLTLVVIGESTGDCVKAYENGEFPNVVEFKCFEGRKVAPIIQYLESIMEGRLIFGVGNIHGIGHEFMHALIGKSENQVTEKV
ncbi:MAG: poly-gamma-glutamate synthase PgsB [Oscillospiraceae bacterium]|nr:poly-gamma-glutamate synthase PgsB [Oscillospiraceae bacterium]